MLEFGIVKFFNKHRGKNYGFLYVLDADGNQTGEELFFHLNDGQSVSDNVFDTVYFDGGHPIRRKPPRKGDKLGFLRGQNRKGDKACPWSYAAEWKDREEHLLHADEDGGLSCYHCDDTGCELCEEPPDEDSLAGDVDPTGGYPEPELDPFEAHRLEVMRQHGDWA
jgi:cold shock CspA family protein